MIKQQQILAAYPLKPIEYRPTRDLLTGSMARRSLPSFTRTAPDVTCSPVRAAEESTWPAGRLCVC